LTETFRPYYDPGVDSSSERKKYQIYLTEGKGDRCVGLTTSPPSSTELIEILTASTSWIPRGLSRQVIGYFYFINQFS
jgi:hypothetical protein